MNFRTIRKHIAALWQREVSHWARPAALGILISSALGFTVLAQNSIDFIDPLKDERARIEKGADTPQPPPIDRTQSARSDDAQGANSASLLTRAREGANSGAEAAQERATGFWAGMKASIADLAAKMGLPTSGLLGLLGLALAALALLIGWTLFRGNKGRRSFGTYDDNDDVYARSSKDISARRQPDTSRHAASSTGRTPAAFQETMPEDFDAIFAEETEDSGFGVNRAESSQPPTPNDASTWRKPNLDRLRDSIKADWKADKKQGDDTINSGSASKRTAVTPLAMPHSDPGELTLTEVSDGWDDWDDQATSEDDPWGQSPVPDDSKGNTDDSAMRRIRALRESLRAS